MSQLSIRGAHIHNLKNVHLSFPLHQLIVVTGVSGSGKSSLAFDLIAQEGERRFMETFSSYQRQLMQQGDHPEVDSIEGLPVVIKVHQHTRGINDRSTAGTMSDIYEYLRLLFARVGKSTSHSHPSKSLFSFNTSMGACPHCHGLGKEELISTDLLIADESKSLREGALVPTLPNGYIMYSQVTIDVLNQVCQAHGFNVDIPWNELTEEQRQVILRGSERIKVPFGKHTLESRLKWTGMTAKPREEGYYKGMLTIMEDILKRDRNKNILRFVEARTCSQCNGSRLGPDARSYQIEGYSISDLAALPFSELSALISQMDVFKQEDPVAYPILEKILQQTSLLTSLGAGHLSCDRPASSLSGGEIQRLRLSNQLNTELQNVLYVFDEPSIGLHPSQNEELIKVFRKLVNRGNTVMLVEHDLATIREADWIIDIGPKAGHHGGELLFNGTLPDFLQSNIQSPTLRVLKKGVTSTPLSRKETSYITVKNCTANNLKNIDVSIQLGAMNTVIGKSGAGKSSFVHHELIPQTEQHFSRVIKIDQKPIGKTSRSNLATYTGLADKIRDLFASLPSAKERGFKKGHFSFNNKGGRCETCLGVGHIQIGMHFLNSIKVTCASCNGARFNQDVRATLYKGKSIADVYSLTVTEALGFFKEEKKILPFLEMLMAIGLDYLQLGQPSPTLSGGEAQRIKLASELVQTPKSASLYVLDEPTTGLHVQDIHLLVDLFQRLASNGHTVVCIEHEEHLIRTSDHLIELGPESGNEGGWLIASGSYEEVSKHPKSVYFSESKSPVIKDKPQFKQAIQGSGISTHNLKQIDCEIPHHKWTVVTGVSGSGKSALMLDTLFQEAHRRYTQSLSPYLRSRIRSGNQGMFEEIQGLTPAVSLAHKDRQSSSRSTVGTASGILDSIRLLYSRIAQQRGFSLSARHFSFNHESGACPTCQGLGTVKKCDPELLISHPENALIEGAMKSSKPGKFYGDPYGQYMSTLVHIGKELGFDYSVPWKELDQEAKDLALQGTGDREWKVEWHFKNKTRSGIQELTTTWPGLIHLIEDEYFRKKDSKQAAGIEAVLAPKKCKTCGGSRFSPERMNIQLAEKSIADVSHLNFLQLQYFLENTALSDQAEQTIFQSISQSILPAIQSILELGIDYLSLDRSTDSLSRGEWQRLRIGSLLSHKMSGITLYLDEPSSGLDSQQVIRLANMLQKVVEQGNTVISIEHNAEMMRSADHLIEIGPLSGTAGGEIIFSGKPEKLKNHNVSKTAPYLFSPTPIATCQVKTTHESFLQIKGASANNLKEIDLSIYSEQVHLLSGPSGSGKSSLLREVLFPSVSKRNAVGCADVSNASLFDNAQYIKDQVISKNNTIGDYSGTLDKIRKVFAQTESAKKWGWKAAHFSSSSKNSQCENCKGAGYLSTSLDFLGTVQEVCEVCHGTGFRSEIHQIELQGMGFPEVMKTSINHLFKQFNWNFLYDFNEFGLGHLSLDRPLKTLSSGERQRLKLLTQLQDKSLNNQLYLIDEPSLGLHFYDLENLIRLFQKLIDKGHTLVLADHHPMLQSFANHQIQLGPVGGPDGGYLTPRSSFDS